MRSRQPGWTSPPGSRTRRRPTRLIVFALLVPLLTGLFAAPGAPTVRADDLANAQAQKKALEQKIADQKAAIARLDALQAGLRTQIASTTIELNGINANLTQMTAKVASMKAQITQVQAAYNDLVAQVAQLDQSIKLVSQQEQDKQQELATRKVLLASRIRSAYDTDQTSLLETFLSGASFTDILNEVGWYLDVGQQDKQLAQQIENDAQTLAAIHQTVVETRAATDDLRVQTAAQKVELDAQLVALKGAQAELAALQKATALALAAQQTAYAQVRRNKAAAARAVAAAAAAQRRLQSKINSLIAQQFAHGNIPSSFNGTLQWPMGGQITQDFGCTGVIYEPPLGSCAHFHQGIDIVAPYGTPVTASGKGQVVYCGWNYADGADPAWIVIVAHSSALQTWYAHMVPGCPAATGSTVQAGQVIGHEGNTGHSTGAHLHWAVMFSGTFVNPRLFV